eukprot:CAMPEP_0114401792 /NCGR_PEP_ID=MMETSP0102-20121206/17498_1 /TAXON_ID=38822 ORGANISM="Pteridomonas danica, Strain PT" /NCGR_SAMPLE_ID=MMETSP0102 /ASSEMBLY_ACC=CAM_ASM_000212 /LENGTH=48 /DNA_ID= /DNA_START= /DNA_END= /DNA_ORIENTATION=
MASLRRALALSMIEAQEPKESKEQPIKEETNPTTDNASSSSSSSSSSS